MRQNSRGFNSYFLFIILLLMGVAVLATLNGADDDYTREEFISDMEAGRVQEVIVNPNSEVPTGYLRVEAVCDGYRGGGGIGALLWV